MMRPLRLLACRRFGLQWLDRLLVLLELDVMVEPELADQAIAFFEMRAQPLLFLPVGLGQMLGALQHAAGALGAFSHPAAIAQMRIWKLPDARFPDEIAVVGNLALVGLALAMQDDERHRVTRPCARSFRAARSEFPWRRSPSTAPWCRAAAFARRSRRSSGSAAATRPCWHVQARSD